MKISERFCLNKSQYELDFIDIDTDTDMKSNIPVLQKLSFPWFGLLYLLNS